MDYYETLTRGTAAPAEPPATDYYSGLTGRQPLPTQPEAPRAPRGGTGLERAGRYVDNLARSAAQGATFGFMDEISAGIRTGAGLWGDYGAALSEERARDAEFREESPVASTVANIAGGVASPLARLRVFNAGRSASLPGAVGRGAAAGAAAGATAGFGEGEGGVVDRAQNALVGGAVGGVVGGAIPVVARGAMAAGDAVGRRIGLSSGQPDAERIILRDLARDGVSPEEVLQRSRAAGTAPVAVADLGGENLVEASATVARLPGEGPAAAGRLVAARGGENQTGRLRELVRNVFGGEDYRATADQIVTSRRTAANPAYERAWRIQLTPDEYRSVAPFVEDRIGQDAMQRGLRIMELEALAARRQFNPADYGVRRTGEGWVPIEGATPNMRLMDAVKRGYDAIVEGFRNEFGVLNLDEYGRAVNAVRAEYRNTLAGMFPPYRRALQSWSGPSATLDAMSMGRRLLSETAEGGEQSLAQLARLPPNDREAFRLGVARGLMDRLDAAADPAELTRIRQMWTTPRVRERLRASFNSEGEAREFTQMIERELIMAQNNQRLNPRGGSPTMQRQERAADIRSPPSSGALVDADANAQRGGFLRDLLATGRTGGLGAMGVRVIDRVGDGMQQARLERNTNALAPMLFNPDPRAREEVARALIARRLADTRAQNVINPALRGLSRGAAVGGSLYVNE